MKQESEDVTYLTEEEWDKIIDLLNNPAEPNEALKELMKKSF